MLTLFGFSNLSGFICDLYLNLIVKKILLILIIAAAGQNAFAQKVDSIYFHLYTDSLKKGTHNYINVDGKLSNGRWTPLTSKDIKFTTTYGEFKGNDLVLPEEPTVDQLTVKAVLISNPAIWREVTIWIKKKPDDELLKTNEEVLNEIRNQPKKKKKKQSGE